MRPAVVRTAAVCGCAAMLVVAAAFAPLALREVEAFSVRHVQLSGVNHLDALEAVRAAGISTASNLFDDPAPWIEGLRAHPLVLDAAIERRVPGTLVLRIREAVPVAFARTPELRAIDVNGRILPADPAADDMDLPVLTGRTRVSGDGHAEDDGTLRAVRFLGIVARHEPGLLTWISEVGTRGDAVRLILRSATDAEVLVMPEPSPERLRELYVTLHELATPRLVDTGDSAARSAPSELSRVRRIDVRFHDQIVVSLHKGKS